MNVHTGAPMKQTRDPIRLLVEILLITAVAQAGVMLALSAIAPRRGSARPDVAVVIREGPGACRHVPAAHKGSDPGDAHWRWRKVLRRCCSPRCRWSRPWLRPRPATAAALARSSAVVRSQGAVFHELAALAVVRRIASVARIRIACGRCSCATRTMPVRPLPLPDRR
jgi:hypothetical protein